MQYWNEMNEKYGFDDGAAIPPDAFACRGVYLRAVNTLATKHGSACRVVAYDRPGVHNCCIVVTVTREYHDSLPAKARYSGQTYPPESAVPKQTDDALRQAIAEAFELDLDSYVGTTVTIDRKGLRAALSELSGK